MISDNEETDLEMKLRIQRIQHRHRFDLTGQDEENEFGDG